MSKLVKAGALGEALGELYDSRQFLFWHTDCESRLWLFREDGNFTALFRLTYVFKRSWRQSRQFGCSAIAAAHSNIYTPRGCEENRRRGDRAL